MITLEVQTRKVMMTRAHVTPIHVKVAQWLEVLEELSIGLLEWWPSKISECHKDNRVEKAILVPFMMAVMLPRILNSAAPLQNAISELQPNSSYYSSNKISSNNPTIWMETVMYHRKRKAKVQLIMGPKGITAARNNRVIWVVSQALNIMINRPYLSLQCSTQAKRWVIHRSREATTIVRKTFLRE